MVATALSGPIARTASLQPLDEPGLRGDRAGIAGRPMLVVEHQEELVGDLGVIGEVPGLVGDRDRRCRR